MTLPIAAGLVFAGYLALSLSMNRHYRQVFDRTLPATLAFCFRILGWSGLLLALTACVVSSGWGAGLLLWLGLLSALGLISVLLLAFR